MDTQNEEKFPLLKQLMESIPDDLKLKITKASLGEIDYPLPDLAKDLECLTSLPINPTPTNPKP